MGAVPAFCPHTPLKGTCARHPQGLLAAVTPWDLCSGGRARHLWMLLAALLPPSAISE